MGVWLWLAMAASVAGASEPDWREQMSLHFIIRHQGGFLPKGFGIELEKMHSRLRLDLAPFAPWVAKERLNLYLYKDKATYLASEFSPPEWSYGLAVWEKKAVLALDEGSSRALLETIAHETTHLLFGSYWREAGKKSPPSWLNEGLAMVEEGDPAHPERSDRYSAMTTLPERGVVPLGEFIDIKPRDYHGDEAGVGQWYTQAYSVVYFLLRQHSRVQFKNFCSHLRDGKGTREALWLAYRYQSVDKLQKAWLAWLNDPVHRRRLAQQTEAKGFGAEDEKREPFGQIKGFKPLRP